MYFKLRQSKPTILAICFVLTMAASGRAQSNTGSSQRVAPVIFLESTKEQDGLIGPVRRVQSETAKLETKSGSVTEGQRQLLEVTTYNLKGQRIDNVSYPVAGASGSEEYKYDDKGNIVEMTQRSGDGAIISKEVYSYEIDPVGNWTKMTTSLVVFEGGKLRNEPVEVTYRSISYFYDEKIAKLLESKSPPVTSIPATPPESVPSEVAANPTKSSEEPTDSKNLSKEPAGPKNASRERAVPVASPVAILESPSARAKSSKGERTLESPEGSRADSRAGSSTSQPDRREVSLGARDAGPLSPAPAPAVVPTEKPAATNTHKAAYEFYKNGREQLSLGNFTGAVQFYRQAIQLEPDFADVYLSLGHAYLKLEKSQDAIKAFKEATRLNPDMEEAHYGMGLEYFRTGNMKDAAKAFKKAVTVRPKMAKAHYGLALAYQDMGKQDLLLEEYRILQTLDSGLARKLSDSFPEFNLPCGGRRCD